MTSITGTTNSTATTSEPTIESLISSWTRSLRAAGKSPNTITGYLDGVLCFVKFLEDAALPSAVALIRREHIEMFLERQLAEHKLSMAATRFRSLRLLWTWCVEEEERSLANESSPRGIAV